MLFIKLLSQAYLNVTDQQNQLIQQPVQPKQLDLFDQQKTLLNHVMTHHSNED